MSLALLPMSLLSSSALAATTLYINADIYSHADAQAIVIEEGKFKAFVSNADALTYKTENSEVIDLGGAFVLPGFIDNHNHVFEARGDIGSECILNPGGTLKDHVDELVACRDEVSDHEWVIGYGFSINALLDAMGRVSPLEVLDKVFPHQPAVIMEETSHSVWANSLALRAGGVTSDMPVPVGGRLLYMDNGEFSGILLDNAGDELLELAWNSSSDKFNRSYNGLMMGLEDVAANGITTIGDGRMYWRRGWFDVWQAAEKNGDLTARVALRPWIYPDLPMNEQLRFLTTAYSADPDRLLRVDQVKMYSDGIIINSTAKLLAPYMETYLEDDLYGINYISQAAMETWLKALMPLGYGAHIHAIGDGAVRESLTAISAARRAGSELDYTLTHVELVNKLDVPRFAQLGVSADFQVSPHYVTDRNHEWAELLIGARRARTMVNLHEMFKVGTNVTLSSDWNVLELNPLLGIAASVELKTKGLPNIDEAIKAYTINAAKSLGIDEITGSLTVGKFADMVVLSDDITKLPLKQVPETEVLMTVLAGEIVFDAQ
ncbi:amidohydrolase [Thaumasiovibrio subtropicus]|uniref:amidohydrolase n=1 Tax=Thaumasiovibrio subtropicus TaxID=1891207 RepID=UPI000B350D9E|nr:amidohydrolase [Thaumasiovibrio subtropicus]